MAFIQSKVGLTVFHCSTTGTSFHRMACNENEIGDKIMETLPTSQYTAYSENKGEKLALCLNAGEKSDEGNEQLIDEHTLMFVSIHELSHIATKSIGHKNEFWENFKFLLQEAHEAGIHKPKDYGAEGPQPYCGMDIRDNPYYDDDIA